MKLFDFLKLLFSSSKEYDELNTNKLGSYFFMTNRIVSIKKPVQANRFNHIEINTGHAVNSYHDMFYKMNALPQWVYSCSRSEKSANKLDKPKVSFVPKESTIELYCQDNNITYKEIDRLYKLYPNEFSNEIKEFEESIEQTVKKVKK